MKVSIRSYVFTAIIMLFIGLGTPAHAQRVFWFDASENQTTHWGLNTNWAVQGVAGDSLGGPPSQAPGATLSDAETVDVFFDQRPNQQTSLDLEGGDFFIRTLTVGPNGNPPPPGLTIGNGLLELRSDLTVGAGSVTFASGFDTAGNPVAGAANISLFSNVNHNVRLGAGTTFNFAGLSGAGTTANFTGIGNSSGGTAIIHDNLSLAGNINVGSNTIVVIETPEQAGDNHANSAKVATNGTLRVTGSTLLLGQGIGVDAGLQVTSGSFEADSGANIQVINGIELESSDARLVIDKASVKTDFLTSISSDRPTIELENLNVNTKALVLGGIGTPGTHVSVINAEIIDKIDGDSGGILISPTADVKLLNTNNSFTGGLFVQGGTLRAHGAQALGNQGVSIRLQEGARLISLGNTETTLPTGIIGTQDLRVIDIGGAPSAVTALDGAQTVFGSLRGDGDIIIEGEATNLQIGNGDKKFTYSGAITGAGSLTKIGSRQFTYTGNQINAAEFLLLAGTVQLRNNATLSKTVVQNPLLGVASILDINTQLVTFDGLQIGAPGEGGKLKLSGLTQLQTTSLDVLGQGVVELSSSSTITGPTYLAAGATVQANGITTATFNGPVTGSGTFVGSGTILFTDVYAPGESPSRVVLDAFTGLIGFASTNTLKIDIEGTDTGEFDQLIAVNAMFGLGGTLEILNPAGVIGTFKIIDGLSLGEGRFSNIIAPDGQVVDVQYDVAQGDVMIQIVPEPATLALLGLGGLVLIGRRRQNR